MNKRSFSPEEIVERLHGKGMKFSDVNEAYNFFRANPYYRFRGYFLDFIDTDENKRCPKYGKKFTQKVDFEHIQNRYYFDNIIRHTILEPVTAVEVSLRATIAEILGQNSAYEYIEESFYDPNRTSRLYNRGRNKTFWDVWEEKLRMAKELCPVRSNYPNDIPIWAVIGHMDFGALEITLSIMKDEHFNRVKENLGYINRQMFLNHIAYIRNLRNLCSHHEQLWGNNIKTNYQRRGNFPVVRVPWDHDHQPHNSQLYGLILILLYCNIKSGAVVHSWIPRLLNMCEVVLSEDDLYEGYGFPKGWKEHDSWKSIIAGIESQKG